ncbi:DedA family protein [Pseudomonadota bacterium]
MEIIINLVLVLAEYFLEFGYFGIFILMLIESSFIPFPSEIVMIPAGYFASTGQMNMYLAIFLGTLGSLIGAIINYYLSFKIGREILLKCKIINEKKLKKAENYFEKHGVFSIFIGRLLPVIRQYISIPAGICRMNFTKFSLFTAIGAGIWVTLLTIFGYIVGNNKEKIIENLYFVKIFIIVFILLSILSYVLVIYIIKKKRCCNKDCKL